MNLRLAAALCVALSLCALLAVPANFPALGGDARLTLAVFALATCAWIGTPVDDSTLRWCRASAPKPRPAWISSDTLFGTLGTPHGVAADLRCSCWRPRSPGRGSRGGRRRSWWAGTRTVRQLVH